MVCTFSEDQMMPLFHPCPPERRFEGKKTTLPSKSPFQEGGRAYHLRRFMNNCGYFFGSSCHGVLKVSRRKPEPPICRKVLFGNTWKGPDRVKRYIGQPLILIFFLICTKRFCCFLGAKRDKNKKITKIGPNFVKKR